MSLSYTTCPKCGHQRGPTDTAAADRCPACGLIFEKYLRARLRRARPELDPGPADGDGDATPSVRERLQELLFEVPDSVDPVHVYARGILLLALAIYGMRLAAMVVPSWEMARSLMHLPMVP